jgi:hypothetical protein
MQLATLHGRRWQHPLIGRDHQGRCRSLSDGEDRLRPALANGRRGTSPISTDTNDDQELSGTPQAAGGRRTGDPIRRALQYRWLSTAQWLVDLGLLEACGSRPTSTWC